MSNLFHLRCGCKGNCTCSCRCHPSNCWQKTEPPRNCCRPCCCPPHQPPPAPPPWHPRPPFPFPPCPPPCFPKPPCFPPWPKPPCVPPPCRPQRPCPPCLPPNFCEKQGYIHPSNLSQACNAAGYYRPDENNGEADSSNGAPLGGYPPSPGYPGSFPPSPGYPYPSV